MVPAHLVAGDYDKKKPAPDYIDLFHRRSKSRPNQKRKRPGLLTPVASGGYGYPLAHHPACRTPDNPVSINRINFLP
ncbi:hypothetical protein TH5_06145 [Thalassospira xianhensis MCCC 1A02616]|uniref:Uncharacterized protein n=1 Tax=Thalassospira xianhensis MCCC 1A02616 TaxID=1177929 RepID=A0A367UET6_9PROT|nr:hypothetical protein TH5_06145 [Thalassospira xianhensis MCCC 1A02616]